MSPSLQGSVAIVTGASRGLGAAIVRGLLERGASVVAGARRVERFAELQESVAAAAERLLPMAADLRDEDAPGRLCEAALGSFGAIDLLVNNAAVSPHHGPATDVPLATFRDILDTNVVMTWWTTAVAVRAGLRHGAVINIGSIGGFEPASGFAPYSVSKAALHHLTRQMAAELAPGVRVNAVAPAVFDSDFSTPLLEVQPDLGKQYPLQRIGTTADVARLVLFLLEPESSWITGQVWPVDGGLLSRGLDLV